MEVVKEEHVGFKTGPEDSSPKTKAGTGVLGLESLGLEWITTVHFSERNQPLEVERSRPTYGGGSQGQNLKLKCSQRQETWRSVHTALYVAAWEAQAQRRGPTNP